MIITVYLDTRISGIGHREDTAPSLGEGMINRVLCVMTDGSAIDLWLLPPMLTAGVEVLGTALTDVQEVQVPDIPMTIGYTTNETLSTAFHRPFPASRVHRRKTRRLKKEQPVSPP
jgi:hypothetical protein